ncbi:nitroreductase family deazaflavin-dependent oxidoreductase [Actinopolymorpha alba]|uniref:nitroreductase family deazaflavin-dependent oxidoreductase n=1 Tax=Actinopolymorpha alba TaxID=533267 RepID=UPI0003709AF8|nr:nitroreductase family deazaflavin-dependent oxidoreductase [Actinopolymorpha alba]
MPLPRAVARANRVGINRIVRFVAPWLPGFGLVIHQGRRSGRTFRTPVNVFRQQDGFVIALTYGPEADWVMNVEAAGGCELLSRGRRYTLSQPRVFHDETRAGMPAVFVRQVLSLAKVADFLSLKAVSTR